MRHIIIVAILTFLVVGGNLMAEKPGRDQEAYKLTCLSSGPFILATCSAELSAIREAIDFSEQFMSPANQLDEAVGSLARNSLPTAECCTVAFSFNSQQCHCVLASTGLLDQVGVSAGALDSTLRVMSRACERTFEVEACVQ